MRVLICCPGPSLARFDPATEPHALTIGVNTAAERFQCDWWSIGDWQAFERITPLGRPQVFTMPHSVDYLHRTPHLAGLPFADWLTVGNAYNPPQGWDTYSATAALVLALHLGATEIVVAGADMADAHDFAGRTSAGWNNIRWGIERDIFRRLVDWLAARGVRVVRLPSTVETAT